MPTKTQNLPTAAQRNLNRSVTGISQLSKISQQRKIMDLTTSLVNSTKHLGKN